MMFVSQKPRTMLFCSDFETTTSDSEYYQRTGDVFIYGVHLTRVPLGDDIKRNTSDVANTRGKPIKGDGKGGNHSPGICDKDFGTGDDELNFLASIGKANQTFYLYFHNGQKFDFVFIYQGLVNHKGFRRLASEPIPPNANYFTGTTTSEGNAGTIYIGKDTGYLAIELRDTIRIQPGTIESIGEDLFGEHGAFSEQAKSNPGFAKLRLKKFKDIEFDYVQDLDGDSVICKDGYVFNIHNPKQGPDMIKTRVGSDVYIMVGMLYYYILNQIINPRPNSNHICLTTGQVATQSFYLDFLPFLEVKPSKEGGGDMWYGNHANHRLLEYEILNGDGDLATGGEGEQAPKIMRGGFTNGLKSVQGQELKGYMLSYDVNSEYPFIATHNLPFGLMHQDGTGQEILEHDELGGVVWFKAKHVKQLIQNVPAMLLASMSEDEEEGTDIYDYEMSNFFGCCTKDEGKVYMNSNYFKGDDVELVKCFGWKTKPVVKHYMETNYQLKQQASKNHNKSQKLVAKLKLNSLTGKFSQKLERVVKLDPHSFTYEHLKQALESGTNVDVDKKQDLENSSFCYDRAMKLNHPLFLITLDEDCTFANAPLYCAITGGGRAGIQGHMLEIGYHFPMVKVVYSDTDSMKIWCPNSFAQGLVAGGLQAKRELNEDELGMFKEEFDNQVSTFKYVCPKKYFSGDKDGNVIPSKSALSGVKGEQVYKKLNQPKLKDFYLGAKFEVLKPKKTHSGVVLLPVEYEFKE